MTANLQKAVDIVTKAVEEDKNRNYEEALKLYDEGVKYFLHAMKYEAKNDRIREKIRTKTLLYTDRAERIRTHLNDNTLVAAAGEDDIGSRCKMEGETSDNDSDDDTTDQKNKKIQISGGVTMEKPNVKFDDVAGLEQAKTTFKEAVILPVKFPHLFTGRRRPWGGILLFGPPGTGKSLLAQAVATEADNTTLLSVSAEDLISSRFGDGERILKEMFQQAREHSPSLIFIDEIDALSSFYREGRPESCRRIRTEFMVQFQELKGMVLVIGSTNTPWEVDPAIRKRFEKRIYIALPKVSDRIAMFKLQLGSTPHNLQEHEFKQLGEESEGYSGADISTAVRNAIMQPMKIVLSATHFRKVRGPSKGDPDVIVDDMLTPCSPDDPGAMEMGWVKVPGEKLLEPSVSLSDIRSSMETIKPNVSEEDLIRMKTFLEDFGAEEG